MNIQQLEKQLTDLGYSNQKRVTSNRIIIYYESKQRVAALKDIADALGGRYTSQRYGSGWRSSVGAALVGSYVILAKPETKGTGGNIDTLDARHFTMLGKSTTFDVFDQQVKSVSFSDHKTVEQSIIKGCLDNPLLGEAYADVFGDFFRTGKLIWPPTAPRAIINKLGIYIGEVLVGWVLLKRAENKHFQSNPFKGVPGTFYMPTDPAFSGVDSFIEMRNNTFYGISSKFGAGAKASFFTNLFEKGIKKSQKLERSFFSEMCNFARKNAIKYTKSRDFIYQFGVRNILNISQSQIASPVQLFNDIKSRKQTAIVNIAAQEVAKRTNDKNILNALPDSMSAFFTRTIAAELNNDKKSVEQIKEILAGKDYWQANLLIPAWNSGELKFRFINSGDSTVSIIGSKSSIGDITSKQGWVNYELKH